MLKLPFITAGIGIIIWGVLWWSLTLCICGLVSLILGMFLFGWDFGRVQSDTPRDGRR
jgi:hypothetical protein